MAAPTGKLAFAYRTIAALEQKLADVRAQLLGQGGEAVAEYQQLSRYNNWDRIDKSVFDLGMLGSCPERFRALYTHPPTTPADSRVLPVELLEQLAISSDCYYPIQSAAVEKLRALLEQNQ